MKAHPSTEVKMFVQECIGKMINKTKRALMKFLDMLSEYRLGVIRQEQIAFSIPVFVYQMPSF